MDFKYNDNLKIAYEKAKELLKIIKFDKDNMIASNDIVDAVEKYSGLKISLAFCSFSKAGISSFSKSGITKPYGAMTNFELDESDNIKKAKIIINEDIDAKSQRFSIIHELGHLVIRTLSKEELLEYKGKFIISTHINDRFIDINQCDYEEDDDLFNELLCNIFALKVLMPNEQFYEKFREYGKISGGFMPAHTIGIQYFSTVNAAAILGSDVTLNFMACGLGDYTSPPVGLVAAYNAATCNKSIHLRQYREHGTTRTANHFDMVRQEFA